jgi:hypothetical protein
MNKKALVCLDLFIYLPDDRKPSNVYMWMELFP